MVIDPNADEIEIIIQQESEDDIEAIAELLEIDSLIDFVSDDNITDELDFFSDSWNDAAN